MAIVKELKNLGKKMTGAELSGNTVSETLRAIESKYSGGSSGETYETAFELEVGAMEKMDSSAELYGGSIQVDFLPTDSVLYFGSTEFPMQRSSYDGMDALYHFNIDFETGKRLDEKVPGYGIAFQSAQDHYVCTVISSDDSISNTTVKILKKVEQDGDAQSSEKAFDFTATVGENNTLVVTPGEGVTWEAIKSALEETDNVFAHIKLPSDFIDSTMRLRFNNVAEDGAGASAAGLIQAASYVYAVGLNVIASGGETRCVGSLARLSTT